MKNIILIAGLLLIIGGCSKNNDTSKTETVPEITRDSIVITQAVTDSTTVLELLQKEHQANIVSSAMGTFVKGIDSTENSRYTFWLYSVNDTMADMAADNRIVTNGDIVKWHYRMTGPENLPDSTE